RLALLTSGYSHYRHRTLHSFPTRRSSDLLHGGIRQAYKLTGKAEVKDYAYVNPETFMTGADTIFILSDGDPTDDDWALNDKRERSEEHTSELQSRENLVCRLLLEKKKKPP